MIDRIEGVDVRAINPEAGYVLDQLAAVIPYCVQMLREQIKQGNPKANRKGKYFSVKRKAAIACWKSDYLPLCKPVLTT